MHVGYSEREPAGQPDTPHARRSPRVFQVVQKVFHCMIMYMGKRSGTMGCQADAGQTIRLTACGESGYRSIAACCTGGPCGGDLAPTMHRSSSLIAMTSCFS